MRSVPSLQDAMEACGRHQFRVRFETPATPRDSTSIGLFVCYRAHGALLHPGFGDSHSSRRFNYSDRGFTLRGRRQALQFRDSY
jgi:hypothetical protein